MTRQGAEAHWLYVITRGAGDVIISDKTGVRKKVASLKSGDFFGEIGMMTGSVRTATVLATEDTDCFRLDKEAFQDILAKRPEIAEHISHVLARRTVELEAVRDNLDAEARSRRLQTLRRVELFRSMTEEELRTLAARLSVAPFTEGEAMTRQGAEAHWLYVITRGAGEVFITAPDGLRKTVARLQAGDFFGELGMMTGSVRSATVMALEDTECYRLDKEAFHDILQRRPEIAENISHVLAKRTVELEAVRDNLDAEARRRRLRPAQQDIFARMAALFGLKSSPKSPVPGD